MTFLKTAGWNGSGDCRNDNLKMYPCKSLIINKTLFLTLPRVAAINELAVTLDRPSSMTVKKAIDILKGQRDKLDNFDNKNQNWVFQTASYVKDFFGENSTEFSFISQFQFHVVSSNWDSPDDVRRWLAEKPIEAKRFLDNCIETLQHKGLIKLPKQNSLSRLSETALWTILGVGVTGLISAGFFFGNLYSDKQNIELRQDNKLLKDSLIMFRTNINDISNKRPQTITKDTTQNK